MNKRKAYRLNQYKKKKYHKSSLDLINEAFERFRQVAKACGYKIGDMK